MEVARSYYSRAVKLSAATNLRALYGLLLVSRSPVRGAAGGRGSMVIRSQYYKEKRQTIGSFYSIFDV